MKKSVVKNIIFLVCILVLIFSMGFTATAAEKDNCHTMIDKWFGEKQNLPVFDNIAVSDVINKYVNLRGESLLDCSVVSAPYLSEKVSAMETKRRVSVSDENKKCKIKIVDYDFSVQCSNISRNYYGTYTVDIFEWFFYDYDDLHSPEPFTDVAGFGVNHTLTIAPDGKGNYIITDDDHDEENGTDDNYVSLYDRIPAVINYYPEYNPDAAVEYSDKHVMNYNSAYFDFSNLGGDCANFTSQSIYAGGMPQVPGGIYGSNGWFYKGPNNRSATWTGALYLRTWMANNRGLLVNFPDPTQLLKGSPVFYDWTGDGKWDHAALCVGYNSSGTPIINSHTASKYHTVWNYGASTTKYSTVQLTKPTEKTTYTVTYNATGGTGAPASQVKTQGISLAVSSVVPAKFGFSFKGWSLSENSTKVDYAPSDEYSADADTTLYAVWSNNMGWGNWSEWRNDYIVDTPYNQVETLTQYGYYHYILNWGNEKSGAYPVDSSAMSAQPGESAPSEQYYHEYWCNTPLSETGAQAIYYVNGIATYFKKYRNCHCNLTIPNTTGSFNNLYDLNMTRTLYRERYAEYTITFDCQGGTSPIETKQVQFSSNYGTLPFPEKEGYTFKGWFTDNGTEITSSSPFTVNADQTLYAKWQEKIYTVKFDANGGTGAPGQITKHHGQDICIPDTKPVRKGYVFCGWSSPHNQDIIYTENQIFSGNFDVTFYAVWLKDTAKTILLPLYENYIFLGTVVPWENESFRVYHSRY
ncbi:MAG: InlB B-repeat-containing protein [Clostridia bacterium]|nr:InlB B-repeat-containing protein [Clostridia bacterium]